MSEDNKIFAWVWIFAFMVSIVLALIGKSCQSEHDRFNAIEACVTAGRPAQDCAVIK